MHTCICAKRAGAAAVCRWFGGCGLHQCQSKGHWQCCAAAKGAVLG